MTTAQENQKRTAQMFELVIQHLNMLAYSIKLPYRANVVLKEDTKTEWLAFSEKSPNQ